METVYKTYGPDVCQVCRGCNHATVGTCSPAGDASARNVFETVCKEPFSPTPAGVYRPSQTDKNPVTFGCAACHPSCEVCAGPTEQDCTQCGVRSGTNIRQLKQLSNRVEYYDTAPNRNFSSW